MEPNQPPPPSAEDTGGSDTIDLNQPCRITKINFDGVRRTRPNLLAKIVGDIFQADTILNLLERFVQARENLQELRAFSKIDLQVDPVGNKNDRDYEVRLVVEERGRVTASAQTAIDNHSTHLNLQLALPNINGIGDILQLNSKFNKRFYSGECRYSLPLAPWRHLWAPTYSIAYSQYQWDSQPSGFDQEDKSFVNQIDFLSHPQLKHSISFENIWRYIKSSSLTIPIEIRQQSGHSVKSSIKHSMTWDNRFGGNFPYEGILAKLSNEVTTNLVSGAARFTRHELNLQFNTLLVPRYDVILQANLLAGTLFRPHKFNICDRFFAGGPLTLRGFKFQGLAPHVNEHPLGEMSYLSAGVHIYSILPYTSPETPINQYIRPHLFLNTGTIGDIHDLFKCSSRDDINKITTRFKDSVRYSCGFGLVTHFMNVRLEVNYCLPLVMQSGDLSMPGVQWGFGLVYT